MAACHDPSGPVPTPIPPRPFQPSTFSERPGRRGGWRSLRHPRSSSIMAWFRDLSGPFLFGRWLWWMDRSSEGINFNVHWHLDDPTVRGGFLTPRSNHPSRVVEGSACGRGCPLADANHRPRNIAANRSNGSAHGLTHRWPGLPGVGESRAVRILEAPAQAKEETDRRGIREAEVWIHSMKVA